MSLAYAVWMLRSGIHTGLDTATYSRWADALIAVGFNVPAYLRAQEFVAPPLFYLLWVAIVAVLKIVLGEQWMTGVVVLNWVAVTAGVSLTLAAIRRVTRSTASMALAALLFLVAGDLLIFSRYVLSDLMFWGLSTAVLACGVMLAALDEDRDHMLRRVGIGTAVLVVAMLFRPVSLPLMIFWIMALAAWLARPLVERFATHLLVLATIGAVIAIVVHAWILNNPAAWPFGTLPSLLGMVGQEARQGMFVHNANPPMTVAPAMSLFGFVRITLQKLLFFMTPWLPHYSASHTLVNLLFFVPAYSLAMASVSNLRRLAPPQQRAAWVLALYVLLLAVFHSLLLIDSDHRYRLPLLPAVIMLAALGLESVRRPRTLASIGQTRSRATARE